MRGSQQTAYALCGRCQGRAGGHSIPASTIGSACRGAQDEESNSVFEHQVRFRSSLMSCATKCSLRIYLCRALQTTISKESDEMDSIADKKDEEERQQEREAVRGRSNTTLTKLMEVRIRPYFGYLNKNSRITCCSRSKKRAEVARLPRCLERTFYLARPC